MSAAVCTKRVLHHSSSKAVHIAAGRQLGTILHPGLVPAAAGAPRTILSPQRD